MKQKNEMKGSSSLWVLAKESRVIHVLALANKGENQRSEYAKITKNPKNCLKPQQTCNLCRLTAAGQSRSFFLNFRELLLFPSKSYHQAYPV